MSAAGLVVDNFAGGGGASTGIKMVVGRDPDIAVNHNPQALAMYKANHPDTRVLCEDIFDVSPRFVCGGRRVELAWFSPDCTFFSKARGARPFRDRNRARRRRGLAGVVVKWAVEVRPRRIYVENVEEFKDWGPLDDDGLPDPERKGQSFGRWVARLRGIYRNVEWRMLRACDYGAPTTRKRLFVVASDEPVEWPEPTHGPGRAQPYRTAAECIDWSIPCPSIFDRKKELAEATLRRIARGIQRYVIDAAEPFIVPLTHQGDERVHGMGDPMPTITGAHRGEHALVQPYLVEYHSARREGDDRTKPIGAPLPTQDTSNRFGLVSPTLIQVSWGERPGQAPRVPGLHKPLGTIMAEGGKHALVAALLAKHNGGHEATGQRLDQPIDTITTKDTKAAVAVTLLKFKGTSRDGQPVDEPLATIQAQGNHYAQVCAFLVKYYKSDGNPGQGQRLDEPLHTVPTKSRFALVTVRGVDYVIVDIGMRMLTPRELFNAQGFPPDYVIDPFVEERVERRVRGRVVRVGVRRRRLSKTEQTLMCGNSVSPYPAAALARANGAAQLKAAA